MSGSEGSACNKLLNKTKVKDLKDLWLDTGPATKLAGTAYEEVLFEAQLIFEDHVASLRSDSKKIGTQGGDIDFALLVDGLAAERELPAADARVVPQLAASSRWKSALTCERARSTCKLLDGSDGGLHRVGPFFPKAGPRR